jgi:copper chaperone CopZ
MMLSPMMNIRVCVGCIEEELPEVEGEVEVGVEE